jgi:hypothetical protein
MYNLNKLAWTAPTSPAEAEAAQPSGQEGSPLLSVSGPPPAAGWSVTPLQDNKLLVMGGHTKVGKVCRRHSRSCVILIVPCTLCISIRWQCAKGRGSRLLPWHDDSVCTV